MQIDTSSVLRRIEIRLAEIEMPKQVFYEKSGISSGSYSQWNTGMHSPSLKKLQKAALVLGVPVEYLLYGDAPAASEGAKKAPDPKIEGVSVAKERPADGETLDRATQNKLFRQMVNDTNDLGTLLEMLDTINKKMQELK